MASDSPIEWTHHTFNPWWGCTKVSPACDHCYAEATARRWGHGLWGPGSSVRELSDGYWNEPIKWAAAAAGAHVRHRVFCATSMADVFEGKAEQAPLRERLWELIDRTPNLDWLLLTKRPNKASKLVPWGSRRPSNVWMGTTVENQEWAERRLPALLELRAVVRFVSAEPLLGPLDLRRFLQGERRINWVITGGESGPRARPMQPAWATDLRDQCVATGVPFSMKQWGTWHQQDPKLTRRLSASARRRRAGRSTASSGTSCRQDPPPERRPCHENPPQAWNHTRAAIDMR